MKWNDNFLVFRNDLDVKCFWSAICFLNHDMPLFSLRISFEGTPVSQRRTLSIHRLINTERKRHFGSRVPRMRVFGTWSLAMVVGVTCLFDGIFAERDCSMVGGSRDLSSVVFRSWMIKRILISSGFVTGHNFRGEGFTCPKPRMYDRVVN